VGIFRNHAGGRLDAMRFAKGPHYSEGDGREGNTVHRWGLADGGVNRWHGPATFLPMMMV
jgi:hypothetical protein